jgi:hypothetical protein
MAGAAGASFTGCTLPDASGVKRVAAGSLGALEGFFSLTAQHSGLCVQSAASGCADPFTQASCTAGARSQLWEAVIDGGSSFLRSVNSGCCLLASEAPLAYCTSSQEYRWQARCVGADAWELVDGSGRLMVITEGSMASGATVTTTSTPTPLPARWSLHPAAIEFVPLLPTSEASGAGEVWRYTTTPPAGDYTQPSFDDSSWAEGQGAFGLGGLPMLVTRTPWSSSDLFVRRTFTVPANTPTDDLVLRLFHDDDAEVWINGVLAAELSGYSGSYFIADLSPAARAALTPGANTLAAHCHNGSKGGVFDLGLGTFVRR